MPTDACIVVGAGGHALVVMDALQRAHPQARGLAFADDDTALRGRVLLGRAVLGPPASVVHDGVCFHVAIGRNEVRVRLIVRLRELGGQPQTVLHPAAIVSPHATLGAAVFVAAGAVVAPAATIGDGCIVNHGAVVDHECVLGEGVHIAPGATLAGAVRCGRGVLVGAGANVLPGVVLGDGAIVGAGAVVNRDVPPGAVVVGIPASPRGTDR